MLKTLDEEIITSIISKYGSDIKKLNLSNNGLESIKNIEKFSSTLQILNLSNNEISNIHPISHLKLLIELNLSSNYIDSIECLSTLKNLKILNLQGNRLSTLQSLGCISNLESLHTLYLSGNPIIGNDINYPVSVFKMQSNLLQIDDWSRDSINSRVEVKEETPKPTMTHFSTNIESEVITEGLLSEEEYKSQIRSLKIQLDAMNIAFNLQEKTITSSCKSSVIESSLVHRKVGSEDMQLLESFPYYRLLQLWRKQALDCIVARTFCEKRLETVISEIKRERKDLLELINRQEAQSLIWKQRSSALEEKCNMLTNMHSQTSHSFHENVEHKQALEAKLKDLQVKFRNISMYLKSLQSSFDQNTLRQSADIVKAVEKLQSYEKRIISATEKLSFTAAVVAHREVEVRNSIAAINAERRLFEWQRSQTKSAVVHNESYVSTTEIISEEDISSISDINIDPEVESLLRAIFRNLDPNDTGIVPLNLLIVCLIDSYDPDDPSSDNQIKYSCITDFISYLTPLGKLVAKALGENRLFTLIQSLVLMPSKHDLTWGEFLLQLIPATKAITESIIRSRLTLNELHDLRNANLIGDLDWGVIPLALPTTLNFNTLSSSSKECFNERETRLVAERKYLQCKLQEMSRNLERRAEGIKSYFENELRRERLKEDRLNTQITQLKHSLIISDNRLKENDILHQSMKEKYDNQISLLDQKNTDLTNTINISQQNLILKYETMLQEEISKSNRLEIEHNLAQRESSKKEVKCRALQRDLLRMQTMQVSQANDIIELKEKLNLALNQNIQIENEHLIQLKENEHNWKDEKQTYIETISDLKSSLLEVNQKLLVLNEELNKKNAIQSISNNDSFPIQETKSSDIIHKEEIKEDLSITKEYNIDDAIRLEMELFRKEFKSNNIITHSNNTNIISGIPNHEKDHQHTHSSSLLTSNNTMTPQGTAMAAHLSKLVRLAEQAISNSTSTTTTTNNNNSTTYYHQQQQYQAINKDLHP